MKKKEIRRLQVGDRLKIQAMVSDEFTTITEIANSLKYNKSTIARELKNNCEIYPGSDIDCYRLPKSGVCNACKRRVNCEKTRRIYNYRTAQEKSDLRASSSRSLGRMHPDELAIVNEITSRSVHLGQSLHHLYVANPILKEICSERTIRRMCYRGELDIKPHQLRRYVRFKHEYKKPLKDLQLRNPKILIGRTYEDFLKEIGPNKSKRWVEYDSVVGKITDKVAILTITFPKQAFQFGLKIAKGNADSVKCALNKLFKKIGPKYADLLFKINLADNGTEFSKFNEIEFDENGEFKRKTFFTNPYKSTDKPNCERNHEFIRYVLPKGKSLNFITQEILNEIFSNINSYVRESRDDLTPYELMEKEYGKELLDLLGIKKIDKRKVKLVPIV